MIRVILLAVLMILIARAFWSVVDGVIEAAGGGSHRRRRHHHRREREVSAVKLARDPVCGTHVPISGSVSLTTGSDTHYFCSEECRAKFQRG